MIWNEKHCRTFFGLGKINTGFAWSQPISGQRKMAVANARSSACFTPCTASQWQQQETYRLYFLSFSSIILDYKPMIQKRGLKMLDKDSSQQAHQFDFWCSEWQLAKRKETPWRPLFYFLNKGKWSKCWVVCLWKNWRTFLCMEKKEVQICRISYERDPG